MTAEQVCCRACGCTDDDCRACVERTGEPCAWVEPDLCSACGLFIGKLLFVGTRDAVGGELGDGGACDLVFVTISRVRDVEGPMLRGTLVVTPEEWHSLWEDSTSVGPFEPPPGLGYTSEMVAAVADQADRARRKP